MTFIQDFAKPLERTFGHYQTKWLCVTSLAVGTIRLDVMAFEDSMVAQYAPIQFDPEVESLWDFVEQKFGSDARQLVSSLIDGFAKIGYEPPSPTADDCL